MQIFGSQLNDVKILIPDIYPDERGDLSVPFDGAVAEALQFHLVQINQGYSTASYTLRGLHYQEAPHAQAKLVTCLHGAIYSVAVDLRPDSPEYGRYAAELLTAQNRKQMYIPAGFAHGYLTLEPETRMQWYVDQAFCAQAACCIRWDCCGIPWPGKAEHYIISEKDRNGAVI